MEHLFLTNIELLLVLAAADLAARAVVLAAAEAAVCWPV